jgi:hypothetical protein
VEALKGAQLWKAQALLANSRLERLVGDEPLSLFCLFVNYEEKKLNNFDSRLTTIAATPMACALTYGRLASRYPCLNTFFKVWRRTLKLFSQSLSATICTLKMQPHIKFPHI